MERSPSPQLPCTNLPSAGTEDDDKGGHGPAVWRTAVADSACACSLAEGCIANDRNYIKGQVNFAASTL